MKATYGKKRRKSSGKLVIAANAKTAATERDERALFYYSLLSSSLSTSRVREGRQVLSAGPPVAILLSSLPYRSRERNARLNAKRPSSPKGAKQVLSASPYIIPCVCVCVMLDVDEALINSCAFHPLRSISFFDRSR